MGTQLRQPNEVPPEGVEMFLDLLERTGNVSEASRAIGVNRTWAYQLAARDERFRVEMDAARASRKELLVSKMDRHLHLHLDEEIEWLRDGDGELVLDDDLERIPVRSRIPFRDLAQARAKLTEERSQAPSVAIQNNVTVAEEPRRAVSVRSAADVFDVEAEEVTDG